ncbi:type II toxin-antitoxin system HipA family toxin [Xylophilus ampelinus]|uniref:Serine/threonine-protein kinase HipA n=1 Tax=Xylophilus ampelinus TaxID=54067 RepID=A0A318SL63_9BURK|nr:HipA domain-containing protein [Xylophilus ampelinus]MCS4510514.1 HipA domain-containing protein [Xylophilus ampelinus]PYE77971.1 serine/threonine-protein kinase HipA [Xylophilus ampelinus]
MQDTCTIQLQLDDRWRDVAQVRLLGPANEGWKAATYSGYAVEWAFEHPGATDAHALCARWPVGLEPLQIPHWPVFLIDMLPQGFGRQQLLRRFGRSPSAGVVADWPLLLAGAGNPIGHLRVKEAAEWLGRNAGATRGFTDDEVAERGDAFAEYLASHGLFVAGSSGVQGEWPKVLLTRADDGLLYLDHTLPDARAVAHYIVKFGRGTDPQLASILRHEAPYMRIAARLGLRVHAPLMLRHRALFIPRFDRRVEAGRVVRLAQESIATLTGMPGFEAVPSHDQVCRELVRHCTDPQTEVLEYLRRDVANLALGNKDNHARNTAVQRDAEGRIGLTPLYDFAPMYLHPDGIARRIRWTDNDGGRPDWRRVLDSVCEQGEAPRRAGRRGKSAGLQRAPLAAGLRAMAPLLAQLASEKNQDHGLDAELIAHLRPGIRALAAALAEVE